MKQSITVFDSGNFGRLCKQLCRRDADLAHVVRTYGLPPMWTRPNTFQTLVLTILEQQISLAAAYAAFAKLKAKLGRVTPEGILSMSDEEMRACYFSRQKMIYARELALAVQSRRVRLKKFHTVRDEDVRSELIQLKGIGHWTVDVYLMHALRRTDLFPLGDIALVNSLKEVKQLPAHTNKDDMLAIAEPWRPFRTIASMILWHAYIKKRGIVLKG